MDRIQFSSTPEASAELLALRTGELDLIFLTSPELAMQGAKLRPELASAALRLVRDPMPVSLFAFFSTRDPVVGGDAREKVALRRAIAMAFDDDEYIRVIDAGLSKVRHQVVPPGIDGFILDRVGYRRGPDNYRRNPDGSALTVRALIGTSSDDRKSAEFSKRMLDRIGVRVGFETLASSERLKRMTHCRVRGQNCSARCRRVSTRWRQCAHVR